MKIKNLILGTLTFAFAIGSAFASLLVDPTHDYVDIAMLAPTCTQISEQACDQTGQSTCFVLISVGGGATVLKQVFDERETRLNHLLQITIVYEVAKRISTQ